MDRGAWRATVRGVAESQTRLSDGHCTLTSPTLETTHTSISRWTDVHCVLACRAALPRNTRGSTTDTPSNTGKPQHVTLSEKLTDMRLPSWPSGWESACQCRGHGFDPWSREIPHASERLIPWATATKTCVPLRPCSATREACPHTKQREAASR